MGCSLGLGHIPHELTSLDESKKDVTKVSDGFVVPKFKPQYELSNSALNNNNLLDEKLSWIVDEKNVFIIDEKDEKPGPLTLTILDEEKDGPEKYESGLTTPIFNTVKNASPVNQYVQVTPSPVDKIWSFTSTQSTKKYAPWSYKDAFAELLSESLKNRGTTTNFPKIVIPI